MEFPSAKDLDIDIDNLDIPEGMALSVQPPTREHMRDPMWFDAIGRDPIDQRKIFAMSSHDEIRDGLASVLAGWPRYGPAIYEKAANQGRIDIIRILLELGAESDPKTMKQREGEDDEDVPLLDIEHAYFAAMAKGRLDIVRLLVEEGGVPVNYEDEEDGLIAVAYAANSGNAELVRWLLERGATITLSRQKGIGDLSAAIKGGKPEIVEMLLANEQTVAAGRVIEITDLPMAAFSGSADVVHFVLRSDCFGILEPDEGFAGQGQIQLQSSQIEQIQESLGLAAVKGALGSVHLLLKQLTPTRGDGGFEPFRLSDSLQSSVYNSIEDGLENGDIPEIFEVLWDTCLHQEPENEDSIEKRVSLPPEERLRRSLITACANGRPRTVKLLVEKYGTDVNHISHKYFTSPLSRAVASGANPLPGRLEVASYLLNRPNIDIDLRVGEFCNGTTALEMALGEAWADRRRQPEQAEMVRLLLRHGGPVDEVDEGLRDLRNRGGPDNVKVHVQKVNQRLKSIMRLGSEEKQNCKEIVLEYTPHELQELLDGIKFGKSDAELHANDPRGRPLMPGPGVELPQSERAQPTLLQADTVSAEAE
ncbi:hypothetical protein H2200_010252 [Cladophialophora chaetospira]|uniref:Ankyrin repeat protein n=1 Tax=Cladophialophora chaetospira TaxID=386627 RepID=A0AA38X2I9_9EURO|nr:hypothetical protein H2200_010252 [Cladophialophora chaetospira]